MEEVYRAFLGRPNDRALLSAFSLHPETIGDIYQNYGACFASLAECCQFINYVADYPKSDDLFASKWGVSRRSFKPKLNQSIEWMHSHINEILWDDWMNVEVDADGPLRGVIGSLDMVHGPIPDFSNQLQNKQYFSVNYDCPCHKWSGVIDRRGKQFIYFSEWGSAGATHDLTNYWSEGLHAQLEKIDKWLLADRIYDDDKSRLLTGFRGNTDHFSPAMKKWNYTVSTVRAQVENSFSRLKNFSLLRQPFRGQLNHHRQLGYIVANWINIDLRYRPIRDG